MSETDHWLDKIIREARERGEFDDLPGAGRPLSLDDHPLEDPDWRLANRVLKNAGFAPEWIEADREIRETTAEVRAALVRSRDWREAQLAALGERRDLEAQRERGLIDGEWERAVRHFGEAIIALNNRIALFNLKAPLPQLQRAKLDVVRELERLRAGDSQPKP